MTVNSDVFNELIWKKFPVLNDGFVCLVDCMGSDSSVVQAARVSYGAGTKSVSDDRTLIRYLLRHKHTTPFEMAELKFLVRVPMDCWRQWIRHRTASVNEYSTRYSLAIDSMQTTLPDQWRVQDTANRQGSAGLITTSICVHNTIYNTQDDSESDQNEMLGSHLTQREQQIQDLAREVYNERIDLGVAREQARKDLPLSTFTEAYWKIDLHNLLHFLHLRMEKHAQEEIRMYANAIGEQIVAKLFPVTWEAFLDYQMNATMLSRLEQDVIQRIAKCGKPLPVNEDTFLTCGDPSWLTLQRCRERDECREKLVAMGLVETVSAPS